MKLPERYQTRRNAQIFAVIAGVCLFAGLYVFGRHPSRTMNEAFWITSFIILASTGLTRLLWIDGKRTTVKLLWRVFVIVSVPIFLAGLWTGYQFSAPYGSLSVLASSFPFIVLNGLVGLLSATTSTFGLIWIVSLGLTLTFRSHA